MIAIILDTETTGLDKPEVIELACAEFRLDYALGNISVSRYRPSKPIQWGAMAIHHILPDELHQCPSASEVELPVASYWIGHNIDFDWEVLGKPDVKRIDTLALARKVWPDLDSHSQSALYYFTQGASKETRYVLRNAHSAVVDITICHEILIVLLRSLPPLLNGIQSLWELSEEARIPTKMHFGKHKGDLIASVPRAYVQWYRRQETTDPYLLEAFARAGK